MTAAISTMRRNLNLYNATKKPPPMLVMPTALLRNQKFKFYQ